MTKQKFQRRDFLKLTGAAGGALLLTSCSKVSGFFTTIMHGDTKTELPQIENAWEFSAGKLKLDLAKLPELDLGGAVRIEGNVLPAPILVVHGEDHNYYAFKNACAHAGRMIDPVAGTMTLTCTSTVCKDNISRYDYQGDVLSGYAQKSLVSYPLTLEGDLLTISL